MAEFICWLFGGFAALFYVIREYISKPRTSKNKFKRHLGLAACISLFIVALFQYPDNKDIISDKIEELDSGINNKVDLVIAVQDRQECSIDSLKTYLQLLLARGDKEEFVDSVFEQADCIQAKNILKSSIDTSMILIATYHYEEAITHLGYAIMSSSSDSVQSEAYLLRAIARGADLDVFNKSIYDSALFNSYNRVLTDIDSSILYRSNYSMAWFNKAVVLTKLLQFEDALNCIDNALIYDPHLAVAIKARAAILSLLGKFVESLSRLNDSLKENNNNSQIWLERAQTLYLLGRNVDALSNCDSVIKYEPENQFVQKLKYEIQQNIQLWE